MKIRIVLSIIALGALCTPYLSAQDSKITTNLGMGLTVPVNPTGALIGSGVDVVVGAGYNFNKYHSLIGQFMWAGLPANRDAFRPIWLVANRRDISGSSNLFALTANYRFRLQGKTFGAYLIAGGGMYYRRASLSREVPVGTTTVCSPTWLWWGYTCVNGIVSEDQTLINANSTAFGGNGGAGFTIRINEEGYKFYWEARYHYAPTKNISTQLITLTFGFAW